MCGIVGVIGENSAHTTVLEGLKRLEYRGYDSAGIATPYNGNVQLRRMPGKLSALENLLQTNPLPAESTSAIGHTRWATHGAPTEQNAHPHTSNACTVVHNGIIENYLSIKELLKAETTFASETDTETIPALISHYLKQGMDELAAVSNMMHQVEGAFALGILFHNKTDMLVATRRAAPLAIGLGDGANYIASDPTALAGKTNRFIFLENDDIAILSADKVEIRRPDGKVVERSIRTIDLSSVLAGKNGYRHFMLKEIHEQPDIVANMVQRYIRADGTVNLPDMPFAMETLPQISLLACGTAYYACMTGKYIIEQLTGMSVNVDTASEFRYRNPPLLKNGLFVAVSQSGETADTLAALHYAREHGQHVLALTNTPNSTIGREADALIDFMAGTEISVASTKCFTGMLISMMLMGLHIAQRQGKDVRAQVQSLRELPSKIHEALSHADACEQLADSIHNATSMLYLGRGSLFPIAHEGAHKIKEIAYIHAEAYPAGDMKHGAIALVDENVPVMNLVHSADGLFDKMLSNIKEIEARHGKVIVCSDAAGLKKLGSHTYQTLTVPTADAFVAPVLHTMPLQLLAYYTAVRKGTDVDQPRNLAKSVTVE